MKAIELRALFSLLITHEDVPDRMIRLADGSNCSLGRFILLHHISFTVLYFMNHFMG